ncbi:MAG: SUMF1/EgtB/PvdO family nonheme iron enzyme [Bacteroidetes bacterium]|nr:SUMF1/EgtB/PvdO family nonheme iron enzyme [Bacteroidota bacterium]
MKTTLSLLFAFSCLIAFSQNKLALVLGNASYQDSPLRNPVNDAGDVAQALRLLGFSVTLKTDRDKEEMETAVREFSGKLQSGDIALFCYFGHGMQVNNINYLIPVREKIYSETDVPYKSVETQFVIDQLEKTRTRMNIIILDACRDNPFKGSRSLNRGFVAATAPKGTLIAYSTLPGKVASDGDGRNSPFTKNFIACLQMPGILIEPMFKEVRKKVLSETSGQQQPCEFNSVTEDFAFNETVAPKKDDGRGNKPPEYKLPDIKPTVVASGFTGEMVFVQGGTFRMGSDDGESNEKPVHSVTLNDFYIGKTEVTQKQWREVMGSDPRKLKNKGCDQCPVEFVSWNDVQDFIAKLNRKTNKTYRLPTEAEWEYAARGGNKTRGYAYSGSANVDDVAWYLQNSFKKTHPVGQKQPNELGLYDMSGNVWEWCSDWYGAQYYQNSPASNPQGPSSGSSRVYRGGSWSIDPRGCRSSYRYYLTPDSRCYNLGFRLVFVP